MLASGQPSNGVSDPDLGLGLRSSLSSRDDKRVQRYQKRRQQACFREGTQAQAAFEDPEATASLNLVLQLPTLPHSSPSPSIASQSR